MHIFNPPPTFDFKRRYAEYFVVPTVFRGLNIELAGGLRSGEVAYVLADSGRGKSTFLDCLSLNAAKYLHSDFPDRWVYLFLLEMDVKTRSERLMQCYFRKTRGELIDGGVHQPNPLNLILIDETDFTNSIAGITEYIENQEHKPGMIVIDYVDNMDEVMGADWRFHKKMSKQLEKLAKKFDCPVWTASQTTKPMDFDVNNDLLDERHIQGGKAKRDSATLFMSLNYRGGNYMVVNPFKNRRGSTKDFPCYVDYNRVIIEDMPKENDE